MKQFQPGKTYSTRSICDHNCIFTLKVLKRTAKTIQANVDGKIKTLRISSYGLNNAEFVRPHGNYSMAAIISADKEE